MKLGLHSVPNSGEDSDNKFIYVKRWDLIILWLAYVAIHRRQGTLVLGSVVGAVRLARGVVGGEGRVDCNSFDMVLGGGSVRWSTKR